NTVICHSPQKMSGFFADYFGDSKSHQRIYVSGFIMLLSDKIAVIFQESASARFLEVVPS
ncbi:hypothetical protein, partial [Lentilactobacillus parafarraginis]|uniref:hypothetical protein n=1 Tax=Lentilactobacillus parafarraginis TaxID=390842 RepID=UPI001CDB2156